MTNTIPEIPNFDAMTINELRSFWSEHHVTTNKKACELFKIDSGDLMKTAGVALEVMAVYAIEKSTAMQARLDGDINAAIKYEEHLDITYDLLPKGFRW